MAKKVKERIVLREIHLRTTIIGVWRQWAPPQKKKIVVFVSTLSRLFCVAVPAGATYSPPQSPLLDLSGPLGGEGKPTRRGKEGKRRKERERKG